MGINWKHYEKEEQQGPGKESVFLGKIEGKKKLRILPDKDEMPWRKVSVHYGLGNKKEHPLCLRETFKEDCPVCNMYFNLYKAADGDQPRQQAARQKFGGKKRYFSVVIDRDDEVPEPKIWMYSPTLYNEMMEVCNPNGDLGYGDISDPKTGRDLIVQKDLKSHLVFKPVKATILPEQTPLAGSKKEVEEILEKMPDLRNLKEYFTYKSKEEMQALLDEMLDDSPTTEEGTHKYGSSVEESETDRKFREIEED